MGVLDKFLDIMKLSDDDDDYENDDFFDEDDLDDYEEKPKRKLFGRDKKNDEEETFSQEEEEEYESRPSSSQGSKVTPMRRSGRRPQAAGMEVMRNKAEFCGRRERDYRDSAERTYRDF